MRKLIFSLSLVLCASFSGTQNQYELAQLKDDSPRVLSESDPRYIPPYTVNTEPLVVKAMSVSGFSNDSMVKVDQAFEVLEKVVNTEEFKNRVLNFENTKGENKFASNKDLTNEQIYRIFMDGRENLQPNTPGEMNFYLKLYNKRFSRVIGWTNGRINTININWKFFKGFEPSDVAGNLAHEWTHKIGFDHVNAAEHDSAPYAIGYIVREMAERALKGEELL